MSEQIKRVMTEEGWLQFLASFATKGNRLIVPREAGAIVSALSPLDFADWLAKSIASYQPAVAEKSKLEHLCEFNIHKDGADSRMLLRRMNAEFTVSEFASRLMRKNTFVIGPVEDVIIHVYRADVLGVVSWPQREFFGPEGWKHLKGLGLSKCLVDDSPYIRKAHNKQRFNEDILVAHDLIFLDGYSVVFSVGNYYNKYSIEGTPLPYGSLFEAGSLIAVRVLV
ncbi:MAG: hypothetical protein WCV55_02465 [Candidatus Paceibacterota bacterium]